MSKWTLPGWKPFTAPAFAGSPSETQLFREVVAVPLLSRGGQTFSAISFAYRTEQGTPESQEACPPPGTVARLWLANEYGEILARFQPVAIESQLNFHAVAIPFQVPWTPDRGPLHALISCSIPSGDAFTGLILKSCYGLVPPVDGVASLPGQLPTLVGQRRFDPGSNPAVDDMGATWPPFETWLEAHQLPLITFEEA